MTIKYHWDLIQGTDEWLKARLGIITASTMRLILTPTLKIANNEKTRAHVYEIVAQRATQHVEENYQSYDMERGHIEEVYAKDLYSKNYEQIKDCGFITNVINGVTIGFSPDGMVGDDGFVEVKSRRQKKQTQTIIEYEVPKENILQIQTGLLVSGRKWCDYISYSNGMPMFVKRVYPDNTVIAAIKDAVCSFEEKVKEGLDVYVERSKSMVMAERRDYYADDVIKPSSNETEIIIGV